MYGTDRPKEKGHGGNRDLVNDSAARAGVLLSGNNVPDTRDFVNPRRIADLDTLLNTAHVTPPVSDSETPPSGSQGDSRTLLDAIGHLATDKPQRPAMPPSEAPADELARLRAENAKLKSTLQDIRNDTRHAGRGKQMGEADFIVVTRLRCDRALSNKGDGESVYQRGAVGFHDATGLGLGYGAVNASLNRLKGAGLVEIESSRYGLDKDGRRVDVRSPQAVEVRTDSTLTVYELPRRLPALRQTESQTKAALAKSEKREKAKRDAALVAKLEAVECPCCGATGLEALCSHCGTIISPSDYEAAIDSPAVTVERVSAALLEDNPVLESKTGLDLRQGDGEMTVKVDPVSQSELLNNYPVSDSETPPVPKALNAPIRERVENIPSLALTADDILLIARASTRLASQLVEATPFSVATRKRLRSQILAITATPDIGNEERVQVSLELARRGHYDHAITVAESLPSAMRKALLDQYIDIGSKAA